MWIQANVFAFVCSLILYGGQTAEIDGYEKATNREGDNGTDFIFLGEPPLSAEGMISEYLPPGAIATPLTDSDNHWGHLLPPPDPVPPGAFFSLEDRLFTEVIEKNKVQKNIIPILNPAKPLEVTFDLKLYQISDVAESEQTMTLSFWVEQVFRNEIYVWNPSYYANLSYLSVPKASEYLWKPDISLLNRAGDVSVTEMNSYVKMVLDMNETTGVPDFHSLVIDSYPMMAKFSCKFNTYYFPFDEQTCSMTFTSWGYDSTRLKIIPRMEDGFRSDMLEHEEWTVTSFKQRTTEHKFNCCPAHYSLFIAEIRIKRKPLYYIISLLLPTLVVAEVAVIGFFTPTSSEGGRSEKVNLGMATMVALVVILMIVSGIMPPSSDYVPVSEILIMSIILLILLGIVLSSAILRLEINSKRKVPFPAYLRGFFFLAPILLMTKPLAKTKNKRNVVFVEAESHGPKNTNPLIAVLEKILKKLEEPEEEESEDQKNFLFLADLLDRFFLILFSFIIIGMFCVVLGLGLAV